MITCMKSIISSATPPVDCFVDFEEVDRFARLYGVVVSWTGRSTDSYIVGTEVAQEKLSRDIADMSVPSRKKNERVMIVARCKGFPIRLKVDVARYGTTGTVRECAGRWRALMTTCHACTNERMSCNRYRLSPRCSIQGYDIGGRRPVRGEPSKETKTHVPIDVQPSKVDPNREINTKQPTGGAQVFPMAMMISLVLIQPLHCFMVCCACCCGYS